MAIYNPNTYSKMRIRRIAAELSLVTGPVGKHVVAVCHPNELQAHIPFVTLDLPDYTMELAYSAVKVYRPVFMVSDHEMLLQMGIKIGDDCMQMASVSNATARSADGSGGRTRSSPAYPALNRTSSMSCHIARSKRSQEIRIIWLSSTARRLSPSSRVSIHAAVQARPLA